MISKDLEVDDKFFMLFNCITVSPIPFERFMVDEEVTRHFEDQGFRTQVSQMDNKWKFVHEELATLRGLGEWPLPSAKHFVEMGFLDRQAEVIALCDLCFPIEKVNELLPYQWERDHEHWHFLDSNHSVERCMGFKPKQLEADSVKNHWR